MSDFRHQAKNFTSVNDTFIVHLCQEKEILLMQLKLVSNMICLLHIFGSNIHKDNSYLNVQIVTEALLSTPLCSSVPSGISLNRIVFFLKSFIRETVIQMLNGTWRWDKKKKTIEERLSHFSCHLPIIFWPESAVLKWKVLICDTPIGPRGRHSFLPVESRKDTPVWMKKGLLSPEELAFNKPRKA